MKLVKLIDRQDHPTTLSWNMLQALEEASQDVKSGKLPNKGLILFLDDSGRGFKTSWLKAGLLNSEAVALIEVLKAELLDLLKGI